MDVETLVRGVVMSVVVVMSIYAVSFTRSFREVLLDRRRIRNYLFNIALFGLLSILGEATGASYGGVTVSVRDLAPMAAGIIAGPFVGLGAGVIGGMFHFFEGGPDQFSGTATTIFAGWLGGWAYIRLQGDLSLAWALALATIAQALHLSLIVVLVRPTDLAVDLALNAGVPMAVSVTVGMVLLWVLTRQRLSPERQRLELELDRLRSQG